MLKMKIIEETGSAERYRKRKDLRELFPEKIIEAMELCSFKADETIISQDEHLDYLYYVLEGRVLVHTYLANGKNIILSSSSAPLLLGEIELLDGISATMSVKAVSDLLAFRLELVGNKQMLLDDNRFLRKLCSLLAAKEASSARRLIYSSGFALKNRLAGFILRNSVNGTFGIRKVEAAGTLGVSYRHLSLMMARFVKEGLLTKNRLKYRIADEKGLRKLASVIDDR